VSIPICLCKVAYDFGDAKFPATVQHCAFHKAANELFEIVDALTGLTEQKESHDRMCHCLHCRSVRALRKARGLDIPDVGKPQDALSRK
jgi:hypothetical protein